MCSIFHLIAADEYGLPLVEIRNLAPYPAPQAVPLSVYTAPAPAPVLPQTALPAPPAQIYRAPTNKEGEELQSEQISPLVIPQNTRADIRDVSGQYSHG